MISINFEINLGFPYIRFIHWTLQTFRTTWLWLLSAKMFWLIAVKMRRAWCYCSEQCFGCRNCSDLSDFECYVQSDFPVVNIAQFSAFPSPNICHRMITNTAWISQAIGATRTTRCMQRDMSIWEHDGGNIIDVIQHDVLTWCFNMMFQHNVLTWCFNMMFQHHGSTWCFNMMFQHDVSTWCFNMFQHDVSTWCFNMMFQHDVPT